MSAYFGMAGVLQTGVHVENSHWNGARPWLCISAFEPYVMREAPCDEGCWSFGGVTMDSGSLVVEYSIV